MLRISLYNPFMTKTVCGKRIGRHAFLRPGTSAVLFDQKRERVLLTRRADNDQWCLPGGGIEPGESVAEACEREVLEETGLRTHVVRLTGIYSDPNQIILYPDGNAIQVVTLNFEVELVGGEIGLSDETTDIRYFPLAEAVRMKLFHGHAERIRDCIAGQESAFIR